MQIDEDLNSMLDLTAMILVNMKNDPSPPPSPLPSPSMTLRSSTSSSNSPSTTSSSTSCTPSQDVCDCMLCTRPTPIILTKCHTWAWIMRVVFYSLRDRFPEKKFFSLKNDVYEYMMNHWSALGLDRKRMLLSLLPHLKHILPPIN